MVEGTAVDGLRGGVAQNTLLYLTYQGCPHASLQLTVWVFESPDA